MAAALILIASALLILAVLVSPSETTKREREGVITDCQRDPLRPYKRPSRKRSIPETRDGD